MNVGFYAANLKRVSSTGHVYDSRGWGIKVIAFAGKMWRWAQGAVADGSLVFTGV